MAGIYFLFIYAFLDSFVSKNDVIMKLGEKKQISRISVEPLLKNDIENTNMEEINLNFNEEIKSNNKNDMDDSIKFLDVLLKEFYTTIDKLTLVAMYFISMHTINIIHFFFIVIFMIQILKLDFTKKYSKLIVILVQILFLFEYIVDISKNYYKNAFVDNFELFQFLLSVTKDNETYTINISIEIFCYVAIFVFYFQDKLLTSKKYQELKSNKNISFSKYINFKFGKYKKLKKIGYIIILIAIEIYIYLLFIIFFLICCIIEINFLISIKLGIFLLVVGGYFQKTQTFFENINIALKVNYFLIGYCCLSSFVVYGYQLFCLDFFGFYEDIKKSENLIIKNLPSFGLINYEGKNLLYKLLPHFLSNFLSILLYNIMHFIYERIDKKGDKNIEEDEINKDDKSKIIEEDKKENIINIKENDIKNEEKEQDKKISDNKEKEKSEEPKLILKEKEDEINTEQTIYIENIQEVEEEIIEEKDKKSALFRFNFEIEEKEEKYKLINIQIQKQINSLNLFYYLYIFVNFILNLYSPSMILICCYFFTSYEMSISLMIYFFIISFNHIIMFKNILKSFKAQENRGSLILLTQLIVYKRVETKNHHKIHNNYDYKIYKIITYFTLLFLFLCYLYSIIYEFKFNNCEEEQNEDVINPNITESFCNLEKSKYGNYSRSIAYIFGMYNYSDISGLFVSNYLYLLFFPIILASKYIKMILFNLQDIIRKNRESYNYLNKKVPYLTTILDIIKQVKIQKECNEEDKQNIESLINDYENLENDKKNNRTDNTDNNLDLDKFKNIFRKASGNMSLLNQTSMKTKFVLFLRVFKRIYEHFIIFAFISCIVIKINIWSIIYMIIIILLLMKQKNINKFLYVFIFLVISTLLQSLIFLLNMNQTAQPNIDEEILTVLNETFSIPLYQNYLGTNFLQNGMLLGVGINHSQLLLIWCENILIFLIYIYLYYFCFNIFKDKQDYLKGQDLLSVKLPESDNKISNDDAQNINKIEVKDDNQSEDKNKSGAKKIDNDNIIFKLLTNEDFREDIIKLDEKNYEKIAKIMKYNFNEEIVPYNEFHEVIKKNQEQEKIKEIAQMNKEVEKKLSIKSSKNKKFYINVSNYILYLFLHNLILIIILIISMMSPGILSGIVICLCLYFLYFGHLLNKGRKTRYPFIVQRILRFIIIFDISFQLIIQIILIYHHEIIEKNSNTKYILEVIGFREILNEKYEISSNIIYLLGKSFCFFIMTIQKIIYSSTNFKMFYLSYIIKIKIYAFKFNSNINAMIFNNNRINEMNNSLELKLDMEKSMEKLKEQINQWSKSINQKTNFDLKFEESKENIFNINAINNNENKGFDSDSESYEENNIDNILTAKSQLKMTTKMKSNDDDAISKKFIEKIIEDWIYGQTFLIKIYSFLNRRAYCLRFSTYMKNGNVMTNNLKKGKNYYTPNLLKKIKHQIKKLELSDLKKDKVKLLKQFLKLLNKMNYPSLEQYFEYLNPKYKKDKDFDEENVKLYNQLFQLKNSSLFKRNMTKWYLIKKISRDMITIIANNFCWICYFFMLLNHMINASIISLFYPLSIFCYSLLENPRPSKHYWRLCYIYTFIFLIFKCLFQKIFLGRLINFTDENGNDSESSYEDLKIFFEHYPIGIKIYDENSEYFLNLTLDFLVIISLIINRNILMLNGLWEHTEEYFEDIEKAKDRIMEYKNIESNKTDEIKKKELRATLEMTTSISLNRNPTNLKKVGKAYEKIGGYFERLFPKLRNKKPGKDFYYLYALAMILLIFYVLIFYTTMVKDKTYGDVIISTNQFSGMSIIFVLIHMIILIIDRVIYLSQNRYKIKYDYIFYEKDGKKHGKKESNDIILNEIKLSKNEQKQLLSYENLNELSKKYDISIYQNETFNVPLFEKYILHILLTILSHLFIFFYITMSGNYNIYNATYCIKSSYTDECNDFQENNATIFFYLLYLFYLTFSALQIKYGFYDIKRSSIFKNVHSIHGLLFEVYKIIPFYYPIKNVIDWTVTPTSFGIFEWFKFENIYDAIFKTYRLKYDLNSRPVGKQIKKWIQIFLGGVISLILILILIVPLILFSSLNPTSQINNVNSAGLKIYLSFTDSNKQERNILIFENNWAKRISNMTDEVWEKYNYSNSYYTKTFPREQVQIISFYSEPENSLSDFIIEHLLYSIDSLLNLTNSDQRLENERIVQCDLKIETDFTRSMPSETRNVKKQSELLICDYISNKKSKGCDGLKSLYDKLNGTLPDNNTDINFTISGFSPIVRLGAAAEPVEFKLEKELNCPLIFKTKANGIFEIYFEQIIEDNGIQYHVLNEKVSSGTFGYSVIGFYSAFILVIGTYVTSFFNYEPSSIIIGEMPHPEILLRICEGIKKSRYLHDFKNEEYYFNFLIEILRTPELVKELTTSTVNQYEERNKLPA